MGTKVFQVYLVDPVQPGLGENQVRSLEPSKASVVYLETTVSQVIMEFQEHLAVQVRGSNLRLILCCIFLLQGFITLQ